MGVSYEVSYYFASTLGASGFWKVPGEQQVGQLEEELVGLRLAFELQGEELASSEMALREEVAGAEKQATRPSFLDVL